MAPSLVSTTKFNIRIKGKSSSWLIIYHLKGKRFLDNSKTKAGQNFQIVMLQYISASIQSYQFSVSQFLKKFQVILFVLSIVPSERIYSEFLTTKITVRKQWHLICCVSNFFFFLQFTKLGRCKMLRKGSSIVIPLYTNNNRRNTIAFWFVIVLVFFGVVEKHHPIQTSKALIPLLRFWRKME